MEFQFPMKVQMKKKTGFKLNTSYNQKLLRELE